jgi:hypothetical protein
VIHKKDIIHYNIRPAKILIENGVYKLWVFGIEKPSMEKDIRARAPAYAAP